MGTLALGMAASACMGLAAYRMAYGDDHGHAHHRLWTQQRNNSRAEINKDASGSMPPKKTKRAPSRPGTTVASS